jgi:tetratricopeptide (TPR) repeat protein
MVRLRLLAIFALWSTAFAADPKWIHMPSTDFDIYSSAGEGDSRRVLQYFERVRSFFEQAVGGTAQRRAEPVRIIVFGSKKEYAQYRPNDFAAAYYTQIAGRDYIVLGSVNDDVFPIAVHEYVHLVAQNGGLKLPPWLNEGVAELFSTLKPVGDKILVGAVIPGRVYALSREKWVPLEAIVAADRNSPFYNEKNKAGSLYNEGWALTHMLELSAEYSPNFGRLVEEIQKGMPSQQALEGVYGKPLGSIEKDLQNYLRRDTLNARLIPAKLQSGERVAAEPASMFDVKLTLLDLTSGPDRQAETERKLQELVAENPKRPEPYVALGYLAGRAGRQEEALKSFETAIELGSKNPQMLWDYGRMAGRSNPSQAIRALSALLADQPNRMEVRLALAQTQLGNKQAKDAIETLSPVKKVTPADAPRFFEILAYANMDTGNRQAARANAQRWIENTQDTDERVNANRLLRYLEDLDHAAAGSAAVSARAPVPRPPPDDAGTDSRPALRRPELPTSSGSQPAPEPGRNAFALPLAIGNLVELDCRGPLPKFLVQTADGPVALLMDDPKKVLISGLKENTIDMNCGPQKPVAVWIEYAPPDASQPGVKGIARAIHFEPQSGVLKQR